MTPSTTIPPSIGTGAEVDPFLTHPREGSPDTQALMQHCKSAVKVKRCTLTEFTDMTQLDSRTIPMVVNIDQHFMRVRLCQITGLSITCEQKFFKTAADDELLFRATLWLGAMDLDTRKETTHPSSSSLRLRRECLELLQQRVEDSKNCYSDMTISAVLLFMIVEVSIECETCRITY
jgi:hypothetical protein